MSNPLYQRHVISIADLTRHDLETVIATAQQLKREPRTDLLRDKVVAICFLKPPPAPGCRLKPPCSGWAAR